MVTVERQPVDFAFQGHFWRPPVNDAPDDAAAFPCNPVPRKSYSDSTENAKVPKCDCNDCERERDNSALQLALRCPDANWRRGRCVLHGCVHHTLTPCKARDCDVCGPVRRLEKAMEIAFGVRQIQRAGFECAWFVGTFTSPFAADPAFKKTAVRYVAAFIRWLRTKRGMADLQYAMTWELTDAGVLHVNIVMGPWSYVPHRLLKKKWGARCSIELVKDSGDVGVEAAAAYNPEALAGYLNKLSQAVPRDWGRGISFSKGWARLPKDKLKRRGDIEWRAPDDGQLDLFLLLRDRGQTVEISPVEWALPHSVVSDCDCFEYVAPSRGPPGVEHG